MIDMLLLGFGLLAVLVLGVALLEALIRRAELGAALVLGLMVLQAVLIDRVPALTLPGEIRVLPYDVVFALLLAAAVPGCCGCGASARSSAASCCSASCCCSPSCGE